MELEELGWKRLLQQQRKLQNSDREREKEKEQSRAKKFQKSCSHFSRNFDKVQAYLYNGWLGWRLSVILEATTAAEDTPDEVV